MTTAHTPSPAAGSSTATRDPVPFVEAVRAIYGVLRDEVFTVLGDALEELRDQDPDEVRMVFDNAISEVAGRLGLDDDVETSVTGFAYFQHLFTYGARTG